MAAEFVSIERQGRVAIVRFDRGDGKNALSVQLMTELRDAARSFEDDIETSAVVLTGPAEIFSVGYDLKEASAGGEAPGLAEARRRQSLGPKLCAAWEALEPMTFVAIEGWCVGGAVALAVACDLRIVGADATFYVAEIERGMNMSWGSVPRFVSLLGPARTKRLVVMAEKIGTERALEWGLADEAAPAGGAFACALEMAERVAALPPVQVRMCKEGINAAAGALARATSFMDRDQFLLAQSSEDFEEGVRSFLEKRKPKYKGR